MRRIVLTVPAVILAGALGSCGGPSPAANHPKDSGAAQGSSPAATLKSPEAKSTMVKQVNNGPTACPSTDLVESDFGSLVAASGVTVQLIEDGNDPSSPLTEAQRDAILALRPNIVGLPVGRDVVLDCNYRITPTSGGLVVQVNVLGVKGAIDEARSGAETQHNYTTSDAPAFGAGAFIEGDHCETVYAPRGDTVWRVSMGFSDGGSQWCPPISTFVTAVLGEA